MNKTLHSKTIDTNWMLQLIISGEYRVQRHLSIIAFCIVVLYYSPPDYVEPFETYNRLAIFFQILLLAYSNMYFFVPKFLFKKRYLSYGFFVLLSIIVLFYMHEFFACYFKPDSLPYQNDSINFFTFSFMILVLI